MLWLKLGLLAAALVAIAGVIHTHNKEQQEKGAAEVRAQVAEAKAAQEAENARRAGLAQADAEKRVAAILARAKTRKQQLAESEMQREAVNEQLARKDAEYAAWRNQSLPHAVVDELRAAIALTGTDPNSSRLSGRTDIQAGTGVTAPSSNERAVKGIR